MRLFLSIFFLIYLFLCQNVNGYILNNLDFLLDNAKGLSSPNASFTDSPSFALDLNPAGLATSSDLKLDINLNMNFYDVLFETNDKNISIYQHKNQFFSYGTTSLSVGIRLIDQLYLGFNLGYKKYQKSSDSIFPAFGFLEKLSTEKKIKNIFDKDYTLDKQVSSLGKLPSLIFSGLSTNEIDEITKSELPKLLKKLGDSSIDDIVKIKSLQRVQEILKDFPEVAKNYNNYLSNVQSGFMSSLEIDQINMNLGIGYQYKSMKIGIAFPISFKKIVYIYSIDNLDEKVKIDERLKKTVKNSNQEYNYFRLQNVYLYADVAIDFGVHPGVQFSLFDIVDLGISVYIPMFSRGMKFPFENRKYLNYIKELQDKEKEKKNVDSKKTEEENKTTSKKPLINNPSKIDTDQFYIDQEYLHKINFEHFNNILGLFTGIRFNVYKNYFLIGLGYRHFFGKEKGISVVKFKKKVFEIDSFYSIDLAFYVNPISLFSFQVGYSYISSSSEIPTVELKKDEKIFISSIRNVAKVLFLNPIKHRFNIGISFKFDSKFILTRLFHEVSLGIAYDFKNSKDIEYKIDKNKKTFYLRKNYSSLKIILTYALYF